MLGRAILGNPWLAGALRALMEGREARPMPAAPERLRFAMRHYHAMVEEWGEARAVPQMRKHLGYYLKGFPGATELRERLMRTGRQPRPLRSSPRRSRAWRRSRSSRSPLMSDGRATAQALFDETFENYSDFVNPPLARVMKLSGSPVETAAHGTTIVDHAGKDYLDFAGGYGVFTLGHRHPRVVAAVRAQLDRHGALGTHDVQPAARAAGAPAGRIHAGRPARSRSLPTAAPKRSRARSSSRARRPAARRSSRPHGAYHGKTLGALSVSGREAFRTPFRPLVGPVVHVPFGDLEALERALPEAAAFIVEPVQGEGGVNVPAAGYLAGARRLCDRFGALLVADEVQTGLGRCGALFACDLDGVVPDVMTLAKGLSGGVMPIGASIARPVVWNAAYAKAPLLHTSTFGGNELACAAALAALDVLVDEDLARGPAIAARNCSRRWARSRCGIPTRSPPCAEQGCWRGSNCATKGTAARSSRNCSSAASPPRGR